MYSELNRQVGSSNQILAQQFFILTFFELQLAVSRRDVESPMQGVPGEGNPSLLKPSALYLRLFSWALNMVPNLLERVLMYGPLFCMVHKGCPLGDRATTLRVYLHFTLFGLL